MSVGNCTECKVRRDLHWEVQYRKSLHARAVERASRWREKADALGAQVRAQAAEIKRLSGQLEAAKARLAWAQHQLFGRKTERTESSAFFTACPCTASKKRSRWKTLRSRRGH